MKAILGGKDAQGIENFRANYPDFKVANNNFKIVNGLVLEFRGRRNSPLFYVAALKCKGSRHFRKFSYIWLISKRSRSVYNSLNMKKITYAFLILLVIATSTLYIYAHNSEDEVAIRLKNTFSTCKVFAPSAWKNGNESERYLLACGNLCEQVNGKSEQELFDLLGTPSFGKVPNLYFTTTGSISFSDILHIKLSSGKVLGCFLSAESYLS